jgi:hypothetical protein
MNQHAVSRPQRPVLSIPIPRFDPNEIDEELLTPPVWIPRAPPPMCEGSEEKRTMSQFSRRGGSDVHQADKENFSSSLEVFNDKVSDH